MMETQTATKRNLQVVQQAFTDFSTGNIPAVLDACTDDVEWGGYSNPDVPFAGMYFGKTGVMEFFSQLGGNIEFTFFEPYEFITEGDRVIALGRQTAKVKATGKSYDHDWCFTFKLTNGKVQHFFSFVDTRDQAEAFKGNLV